MISSQQAGLAPTVEVYVGDVIEHESERQVLTFLVDFFTRNRISVVILANLNVQSRQIDFVVATGTGLVLVIEAKGYRRPVRGGANGHWETKTAASGWATTRNGYRQALDAVNAFRDEMHAFSRETVPYPKAALAIVPGVPPGSQIRAGDFKVAIGGLSDLAAHLTGPSSGLWDLDRWRDMARSLNLSRVSSSEAACSSGFAQAEQIVHDYSQAFLNTYGPVAQALVPDTFSLGRRLVTSSDLVRHVIDEHADILLRGPSGCGKTLLATQVAVSFLGHGIPLVLQVRHYDGSIQGLLDREAGLLGMSSGIQLLRAVKTLDLPLLLIADGYNECNERNRLNLTRGLRALALRQGGGLVVTSQTEIERADLLFLEPVLVSEPAPDVKAAIAKLAPADALDEGIRTLLDSASSGLEAALVGEVGRNLRQDAGRFDLFDAFARARLGEDATAGIGLLARVAASMLQRVSFSLSVRDLERVATSCGVSPTLVKRLMQAQLLEKHADRVSFRHELFLGAFSAESVIREANGDAEKILAALASPRYHATRALILGAIDDEVLLDRVLRAVTNSELLLVCSRGECGRFARNWVLEKCNETAALLKDEAAQLRFKLDDAGWGGVAVDPDSLRNWSAQESALLAVISSGLRAGDRLDLYLDAVGALDASFQRSFVALLEEARERKVALRSGLFANAYALVGSRAAGVSQISGMLHSGWSRGRVPQSSPIRNLLAQAWGRNPTPGQIYFLIMLSKDQENPGELVAAYLPDLLGERWRRHPYHLQLDLIDCVHWCRDFDEPYRIAIAESLEAILPNVSPLLAGTVFECLEMLGAAEDSHRDQVETVRTQMNALLNNRSAEESKESAWSIYMAQFDHPLSRSYIEVVNELDEVSKQSFLLLACEGAPESSTFFLTPLIDEVTKCGDPAAAAGLQRLARLPARNSFMPQDAFAVFVSAHISLGHLGCALPDEFGTTEPDPTSEALLACGALFYWASRRNVSDEERNIRYEACWRVLLQHDQGAALSALVACETSLRHGIATMLGKPIDQGSIIRKFPTQAATVCREALNRTRKQQRYFPHSYIHDEHAESAFAIQVLGDFGEENDLSLLRRLSDDVALGTAAIDAVRKLEARRSLA